MSAQTKRVYEFGPFRLDAAERVLLRNGQPEPLPPKALEVLLMLVESSGHIVEKDELMNRVWADSFVEEGNLKVTVSLLRKALGQGDGEHQYIETVPRRGYRFQANVRELIADGPALMVVERSRTDVIIEEVEPGEQRTTEGQSQPSRANYLTAAYGQRRSSAVILAIAVLVVAAGVGYGLYRLFAGETPERFQTMKLKALTGTGTILEACISADGKYVAYSVMEGGQESLWLRQVDVATSSIQIAPAGDVRYQAAAFSPDGNYLYYVESERATSGIFRAPVLGGPVRKLIDNVVKSIACSPDGAQLAFLRRNETNRDFTLVIANTDGSSERKLADGVLGPPAWSPDGKIIACGILDRDTRPSAAVIEVRVSDGEKQLIGGRQLSAIEQVAWLADSSGLIVVGQDQLHNPSQLWHVSHPKGEVQRITNDLNDYKTVSLTADSRTLVTVRTEQFSTIWVTPNGEASRAKQITPGLGKQDKAGGLCWTSDGQLVYESNEGGMPGVWITGADGTGRRQLSDIKSYAIRPMVSPDGRYIVFASDQTGYPNIWRIDIDGRNLKRLTTGTFEAMPYCSPDGQWVVYTSMAAGVSLWKVPIDGGETAQLTNKWTRGAVVSPDGKLMVCWYRDDQQSSQMKMGIFPIEGGDPVKVFPVQRSARPPIPAPNYLRWTPDGDAILYLDTRDGISNIWSQPLSGRPPTQVTEFKSDRIFSFDWSRDGKQLAVARGRQSSDIVVITDFK
jgi:Tol biopolymer transport system component/DNA-binding winged helix-turn-helix (wHTH) protein